MSHMQFLLWPSRVHAQKKKMPRFHSPSAFVSKEHYINVAIVITMSRQVYCTIPKYLFAPSVVWGVGGRTTSHFCTFRTVERGSCIGRSHIYVTFFTRNSMVTSILAPDSTFDMFLAICCIWF